ncbi:MAG: hypothetical protein NVS3B20_16380 [Polyangiales bacterium]
MRALIVVIAGAAGSMFWALPALAFEPFSLKDVPNFVGKDVYAASNVQLEKAKTDTWAYAGEPLTVIEATPFGTEGGVTTYNFLKVKNREGKEGEIQLRFLSKSPLHYNLKKTGKAKELAVAVFNDAFGLAARMHAIRDHHGYNLKAKDPDDYQQVDAMEESFKFSRDLLHNLIYSANRKKQDLLSDGKTKWLATTSDDALLDWYAVGIKDAATKGKLTKAAETLGSLNNVSSLGFDIARLEDEKAKKEWRKELAGVPADKVAKIEKENLSRIDAEIAKYKKQIQEIFAKSAKSKATVS